VVAGHGPWAGVTFLETCLSHPVASAGCCPLGRSLLRSAGRADCGRAPQRPGLRLCGNCGSTATALQNLQGFLCDQGLFDLFRPNIVKQAVLFVVGSFSSFFLLLLACKFNNSGNNAFQKSQ